MITNKRNQKWLAQAILVTILFNACGDETEDEEASEVAAQAGTNTSVASQEVERPQTEASAENTLTIISSAVADSGKAAEESLVGDQNGLALAEGDICNEYGQPAHHEAPGAPGGNENWAIHKAYCALTYDSGTEETIQGTLITLKVLSCLIGEDGQFDGVERRLSLPLTDRCLPVKDVEEMRSAGIVAFDFDVTATKIPAVQPQLWAKQLTMKAVPESVIAQIFGEDFILDILFNATFGQELAFATYMGSASRGRHNSVAARLDIEHGVLRYEMMAQDYASTREYCEGGQSSCGGFSNHLRLKIDGEFNNEGVISKLDKLEFAYSSLAREELALDPSDDTIIMATVVGQENLGYFSQYHIAEGNPMELATFVGPLATDFSKCHAGPGACVDLVPLIIADPSHLEFLLHPEMSDYAEAQDWYQNVEANLGYEAVELKAVQ